MKLPSRLVACLLWGALVGTVSLRAAEPADAIPADRIAPERLELKVVKVYTAKDGDALFRAYVVKWKDQEVIVSDTLARSHYEEGDTIPVLVMNNPFPQGKEAHRLLAFAVMPSRPAK